MTDDDRPDIAALQTESWRDVYRGVLPNDYLEKDLAEELDQRWATLRMRPGDLVLIAEQSGLIGFVSVWRRGGGAYIDNLHVAPDRRSGGVGRALMRAAAVTLLKSGVSSATLTVLESNAAARAFYERLGAIDDGPSQEPLGGIEVSARRMVWPDLSTLRAGG